MRRHVWQDYDDLSCIAGLNTEQDMSFSRSKSQTADAPLQARLTWSLYCKSRVR